MNTKTGTDKDCPPKLPVKKRGRAPIFPEKREMAHFLWENTTVPEQKITQWAGVSSGTLHGWRTREKWNGSHRRQGTQIDPMISLRNELETLKSENERLRQELTKLGSDPDDIEQLMILTRKRMAQLAPQNEKLSDLAAMHRELRETLKTATSADSDEKVVVYLPEIVEDYEPEPANAGEIAA